MYTKQPNHPRQFMVTTDGTPVWVLYNTTPRFHGRGKNLAARCH